MKGQKTVYVCSECDYQSAKWLGRCPSCGAWNTMTEETYEAPAPEPKKGAGRQNMLVRASENSEPVLLGEGNIPEYMRSSTGIGEFDRVLGGGLVCGSVILLSGEPGIGKSTLLLQICAEMSREKTVLYVSGEESAAQISLRAKRLGIKSKSVYLLTETNVEKILESAKKLSPDMIMVDSIQTMYHTESTTIPGSITQIRECASMFINTAKAEGVSVILVGHVTKEGSIAGPKVLEHMVDTVLYFEGERRQNCRLIRAIKNRFGSTNEIGVFEMTDKGLQEVENPSVMLLSGRPNNVSGTCVTCTIEGSRPILAETQGLATQSGYGNPRRMSTGFDYNRLSLLLAVLEKRAGYYFSNCDTYINIVGGLRVDEPAIDLSIAMALISSLKDTPVDEKAVVFGEIGLAGEIRAVSQAQMRINEAVRLGFNKIVLPYHNLKGVHCDEAELIGVKNIRQAFEAVSQ